MKNCFYLLLATVLLITKSFALTPEEELAWRTKVNAMSTGEKTIIGVVNVGSFALSCVSGTASTALAAAANTIPIASFLANGLSGEVDKRVVEGQSMLGSVVGFVWDCGKWVCNAVEGDLSDKAFSDLKNAYIATKRSYGAFFSESGYCIDAGDRLKILFGF